MKTEPEHSLEKAALRRSLRRARSALSASNRQACDKFINESIIEWIDHHKARSVGAYMAFDGEPDVEPTLLHVIDQGGVVALPVIVEQPDQLSIEFHHWHPGTPLQANRFGIAEPVDSRSIRPLELDLILMPLVGWDDQGNRLGVGASFYDRFFQPFVQVRPPLRAGVAYTVQKCPSVPSDAWDIPMHQLFSEDGVMIFNNEESK